jgi:hypothetical protein
MSLFLGLQGLKTPEQWKLRRGQVNLTTRFKRVTFDEIGSADLGEPPQIWSDSALR